MSTQNKVFQVLVTKGNHPIAQADSPLEELRVNQLGFYDADTNMALDGTVVPDSWYMAVGLGTGDSATDVRTSAGQEIQTRNIRHFTYAAATPATPTIIEVSGIIGECEQDYSLKVSVTSLAGIGVYGFRPLHKTYSIQTSCCTGCDPCPSGSSAEVAGKLAKKINADKDGLLTAELVNASGAVVTDIDAYMANPANAGAPVKIRLTSKIMNFFDGSSYNQTHAFEGAAIEVFLGSGFDCGGLVQTIQYGKQAEGNGHYIKEKEYIAGGYNGNPGVYRTSGSFNETYPSAMFLSDASEKYGQINLSYDHHSKSGWLDYLNDLNTLIAIPKGDEDTIKSALEALSKLVAPVPLKEIKPADPVEIAEATNS